MSTEMRPEQGIAGKFVRSALDENGVLSKIEFTNSENFNFAYDVMDALAERKPDMEEYLPILVFSQISPDMKKETIKAQTVIARTNIQSRSG